MADYLHVVLAYKPFDEFEGGRKTFEIRKCRGNFSENKVYEGRRVQLRRGYTQTTISGRIGRVVTGNLEEIFEQVNHKLIVPISLSPEHSKAIISTYLKIENGEKYIAFEVIH